MNIIPENKQGKGEPGIELYLTVFLKESVSNL